MASKKGQKYSDDEEELFLDVLLDHPGTINQKTNYILQKLPDRTFYGIQRKLLLLTKAIEEDSKGTVKITQRIKFQ